MKNSTLIEILKNFTGEEFKKFEDFSQSSYFNKNTNIIKLVQYLKILSPRFEDEAIRKENIWKALFGEKKFNYGVLKNIIYETGKIVNMFMSVEIFMKKDLKIKLNNLEFLSMKGLSVQMEKGIRSLKSELAEMNVSNEYFYISSKLEMMEKGNLEVYLKTKKKDFGDYSSFNKYFISYFFSNFFLANNKGLLVSAVYDKDNQNEDLRKY